MMAVILAVIFLIKAQSAWAQNLSATVKVNLDLSHMGILQLNPVPTAIGSNEVFANGPLHPMPIIIRQWSDGSVSVETSTRVQTKDITTGENNQATAGGNVTFKLAAIGGEVGAQLTLQSTTGTAISTTLPVTNSISFEMEGNLLKAKVTYTVNDVTYHEVIDLGTIGSDGSFRALPGKEDMISNYTDFGTVPGGEPAKSDGIRGRVDLSKPPTWSWVLVGYWVTVGSVGGVIVSVSIDPVYELRMTGFSGFINTSDQPGKQLR